MKRLLKEYQLKFSSCKEELNRLIKDGTDLESISKNVIKLKCHRTVIEDIQELLPTAAPVSTKPTAEDIREEEERAAKQKKMDDEHDAFIARLMADDEPEIKKPKGFEDFEPSTGK